MTGFGIGEVLLIAMLVLIVFGPRRLPEITRTIGKGIREFRKGMNEIQ
ncbi:MAG: twin-arginine translocase TatA/TatE family subunit, partial [Gemmatimonadales bacterium]|nr:twin-arginine translocase TatA/TatE family subunit [Gemmatimonadales bacterium]